MKAGDTFLAAGKENGEHLWVIVTDPSPPASKAVIVNFSSWQEWHDQSCVLDVGDHRFIIRRTSVLYQKAKVLSINDLTKLLAIGPPTIKPHDPVTDELLQRIRDCAIVSGAISLDARNLILPYASPDVRRND